ncbi:MAG: hypothetical protein Tsb0013_20170 [Phycisphaerales bacterium]
MDTLRVTAFIGILTLGAGAHASLDINGGSSWGGWDFAGNSLTSGIWADDETGNDFNVYTSVFEFDAGTHSPTGSFFGSAGFGGSSYFADGSLILAIGVEVLGTPSGAVDASVAVPTLKIDTDNNNGFTAASAVGATDGQSSTSLHTPGDFNQQFNGTRSNDGTPSFFGLVTPSSFDTQVFAVGAAPARSFYDNGGAGYQLFLDISGYETGLGTGIFGNPISLVIGSGTLDGGTSGGTDVVLNGLTVPSPGGVAVLALAGMSAIRRRR